METHDIQINHQMLFIYEKISDGNQTILGKSFHIWMDTYFFSFLQLSPAKMTIFVITISDKITPFKILIFLDMANHIVRKNNIIILLNLLSK